MPKRKKLLPVVSLLAFIQTLASCEPTVINPSTSNGSDVSNNPTTDSSNSSNSTDTSSPSTDVNKKYKVIFCNDNGRPLLTTSCNDDGKIIYTGDTPTKGTSSKYTFDGWIVDGGDGRVYTNEELPLITQDTIFIAHYFTELSRYKVRFERDDGTLIEEREFEEGEIATPSNLTPSKEGNNQYTYVFKNWNKSFTKVSENTTYVANFEAKLKEYTIEFLNGDATSLTKKTYKYGTNNLLTEAINLKITPTKAETDKKQYTFNNVWKNRDTNEILDDNTVLKGDCVFIPQFGEIIKTYKVEFKYEDGSYISSLGNNGVGLYQYGDYISNIEEPTKASTIKSVYTFAGWDKQPTGTMVTSDLVFVAKFNETKRKYRVNFYNHDGSKVLDTQEVEYGSVPTYNGVTPTKPSGNTSVYTFANKWQNRATNEVGLQKVTGAIDYIPLFDDETRYYTITFRINNEETKRTYRYGATINIETPTKESDEAYDYKFSGWDKTLTTVTEDKTYIAIFSRTKRKYTVKYKVDDTVLYTELVEYDDYPKYTSKPTKDSTNSTNYEFTYWQVNGVNVSSIENYQVREDTTFVAAFAQTKRTYKVTFLNDNGTIIEEKSYEYNSLVKEPTNVTKESSVQYNYKFIGWDKKVATTVTSNAIYTARFSSEVRQYSIKFIDGNNNELVKINVPYGETPKYDGIPTKKSTAQYSYTFNNTWSPSIKSVSSDAVYVAQFDQKTRSYKVRFVDYDGTLLKEEELEYGSLVTAPLDPSRPSSGNINYAFKGWDKIVTNVRGDVTYTAQYTSNVTSYTITFKNDNGEILATQYYQKDETPKYDGTPTKESTAEFDYIFNGFTPALSPVTGDAEYTATYRTSRRSYAIKFIDYDDKLLQSSSFEYGTIPQYYGTPTRISTVDKDYSFKGWDKTLVSVTGEATYKATYTETAREYIITYVDGDGNVIKTDSVAYGSTPKYTGTTPTKISTVDKVYTFNNTWSPAITKVTGSATYVAQFTEKVREYTITFLDDENKLIETQKVKYNVVPSIKDPTKASTAQYTYTFTSWGKPLSPATSDATYIAQFDSNLRSYNVTFVTDDGVVLQSPQVVQYGYKATFNKNLLIRKEDSNFTYEFSKWKDNKDPSTTLIEGDTEFVAIYIKTEVITYQIIFKNDDGTTFKVGNYKKGTNIVLDELPTKECNEEGYEYVFKGWTPSLTIVNENKEYTAVFEKQRKKYTVRFVDQFGDLIDSDQLVEHGKSITLTEQLNNPRKDQTIDKEFGPGYWSNHLLISEIQDLKITSNMTFVYNYAVSVRKYKITFYNNEGTVVSSAQYEYGSSVTLPSSLPSLPGPDNYHEYRFVGWSPEVSKVTGNADYLPVYSDLVLRRGTIKFILDDQEKTIEDVEFRTSVIKLLPMFNEAKKSDSPNLYYWQFEGVYLNGDLKSTKLDRYSELQHDEETWIAVWTKVDIKYTIIFTESEESNTPLTGCDEFKQVLTYYDSIAEPTIEPSITDRYGIVLNDIVDWEIMGRKEGSSTYSKTNLSFGKYYTVGTYSGYKDYGNEGFDLKVVPVFRDYNYNRYDGDPDKDWILLGMYPQTLITGNEVVTLSNFAKNGNKNTSSYPADTISYDENTKRYCWNGRYYYRYIYDGPEGSDYVIQGVDRNYIREVDLKKGEQYFFKIEPVVWKRRIDPVLTGGKAMLISSKILDYTNYFNPEVLGIKSSSEVTSKVNSNITKTGGPSNYANSNLNSFLNNEFYNELFFEDIENNTTYRIDAMQETTISNNYTSWGATSSNISPSNYKDSSLQDSLKTKIFALSYEEANKFNNIYYDSRNEGSWSLGSYHETDTTASSSFFNYEVTGYAKFKYFNTYKKLPAGNKFNEYYLRSTGLSYNKTSQTFNLNTSQVPVASGSSADRYVSLKTIFTDPNALKSGTNIDGTWKYDMSNYVSGVVPAMYASYPYWSKAGGYSTPFWLSFYQLY